jgi:hypothetical protein
VFCFYILFLVKEEGTDSLVCIELDDCSPFASLLCGLTDFERENLLNKKPNPLEQVRLGLVCAQYFAKKS